MAMSKSNIATGLSVFGLLAVVFGTVLVFVGPVVVDNQIVKVSWFYKIEMDILTQKNQFMLIKTNVKSNTIKNAPGKQYPNLFLN